MTTQTQVFSRVSSRKQKMLELSSGRVFLNQKSVKGSLLWIFEHKIFIVTEHRTYSIKREKMGNHVFSPTTSIYTVWPGVCTKKIHFITCLKLTNISFCLMWGFPSLRWDFTVYTVTLPVLRVFHYERCRIRTRDHCLRSLELYQWATTSPRATTSPNNLL